MTGSSTRFLTGLAVVSTLATIGAFVLALLAYFRPPREVIQVGSPAVQVQVQTPTAQQPPSESPRIESAHATFDRSEAVAIATPEPRIQLNESPPEPIAPVKRVDETRFIAVVPSPKPVLTEASSALLFAARVGDHDAVKKALENWANPNAVSYDGKTALIHAAENGHHDICKTLVRARTLTATTDQRGRNALHYAAEAGHNDLVHFLLENQTRADAIDVEGNTPLVLAERGAHNTCANVIREFLQRFIR